MYDNLDDGIDLGRWHACASITSFADALMYKELEYGIKMAIHNAEVLYAYTFHYHAAEHEECKTFRFWLDKPYMHFYEVDVYGSPVESYPDPVIEMINEFAKIARMGLL